MQLIVKIQSIKKHYEEYKLSFQTLAKGLPERVPVSMAERKMRVKRSATIHVKKEQDNMDDNFVSADLLAVKRDLMIRHSLSTVPA